MKTKDIRINLKQVGDAGAFQGYAAIFGNVDDGKDRIHADAFKEIVKSDGKVKTLYMHDMRRPIGLATVGMDSKGLHFDAQLELGLATAREAHVAMKAGLIDGMSIGYDVLENGSSFDEQGVRDLTALKLWEISPVTFGMNPLARIDAVKQAGELKTIRDYESFLRDVGGFDRARAKALASGGWDALLKVRDEPAGDREAAARIAETVGRHFASFKSK